MADSLYLSRVRLPARSRDTQRLLADCHAMHRFVMRQFPQTDASAARADFGVLHRVEPAQHSQSVAVLIQSASEPRWAFESAGVTVEGPRSLEQFLGHIRAGQEFRFRLRANPTKRVSARSAREQDPGTGRECLERPASVGKRVAVRGDEQRMAWLARKAEVAGFTLLSDEILGGTDEATAFHSSFTNTRVDAGQPLRDRASRLTFETCVFEGLLRVTDPDRLQAAIRDGIGSGKAFGCGLLSLAPVPPR